MTLPFKGVSPGGDKVFSKSKSMSRNNVNVTKHHLHASAIIIGILSGGFVDYRASFIEDFRYENIDFGWENH